MPRIAVTGTTGRVGRALARRMATDHEVIELPRTSRDCPDPPVGAWVTGLLDGLLSR